VKKWIARTFIISFATFVLLCFAKSFGLELDRPLIIALIQATLFILGCVGLSFLLTWSVENL
jgi:hypothetical protein